MNEKLTIRLETVETWGQRVAPEPQTAVYQSEFDVSWRTERRHPVDRVGIYLGENLVVTVNRSPNQGTQ